MHFQTSVQNWTQALVKMPDYTLLKAVNDAGLLLDGYNKWTAAGRDPSKLWLCHRYFDFYYPDFDGADRNKTLEEYKVIWRNNFKKTIDGTYYNQYAPYIRLIEELNEYVDSRMVTDKALLAPRLRSAQAAVLVWNSEYRGKNGIPDDARIVVANSPVGNDVPREYFELCRNEDAVLGVHLYTRWDNKQRDSQDFRYHSGRVFYNEADYGIKVDIAITESSPYAGVLEGWRHGNVMGGDRNLLIQGMSAWWQSMAQTPAYKEGRILGPGAWFTSSRLDDQWDYYRLWDSELIPLAEECAKVWKPGTVQPPPPPPPPPPPDEDRGKPRVQYQRVYHVVPQNWPAERVGRYAAQIWEDSKGTVGGSWDDAMIGDLDKRTVIAYDILPNEYASFVQFRDTYYPGVVLKFMPWLGWPLDRPKQTSFQSWAVFNAERDYGKHEGLDLQANIGDGVLAMRDGIVTWASNKRRSNVTEDSNYGNHIIINHGDGWFTWYAHLDDMISAVDDIVYAGDLIGYAGNTGNSTGPHLHINVQSPDGLSGYVVAKVVNPRPLLGV